MQMKPSDHVIVANLRREYGDKLKSYSDETIAAAWRDYSSSDDYQERHTQPDLFIDWCANT